MCISDSLYTAAERTHRLGEALIRPMYYRYADRQEAYQVPNQYFFGTQLMVCPITTPMDRTLMLAQTTAWLPEGLWFDFATGQPYTGGRMMKLWRDVYKRQALLQEHRLNLGREYINALDNEHIVAAATGFAHLHKGTSTGALFAGEYANVAGAIAQQGERLLGQGSENQLALGSFGQNLPGVGIDDLRNEVILVDRCV